MIWCFPSKSVSKHLEVPLREKCSCLRDTTHISPPHKQKRSAFRNFLHAWQLLLETLLRKLLFFFFFRTLFITRITLAFKMTLYLRDFHSRHYCFIVENSATVWLVRKQLWLTGENKVSLSINCESQHFLFASFIHKSIVTDSGKVTANKHTRNFYMQHPPLHLLPLHIVQFPKSTHGHQCFKSRESLPMFYKNHLF